MVIGPNQNRANPPRRYTITQMARMTQTTTLMMVFAFFDSGDSEGMKALKSHKRTAVIKQTISTLASGYGVIENPHKSLTRSAGYGQNFQVLALAPGFFMVEERSNAAPPPASFWRCLLMEIFPHY